MKKRRRIGFLILLCIAVIILFLLLNKPQPQRKPYDLNGDGKIDIEDLEALKQHFGSYPGHPRWNENCDLNHDGIIDLQDAYLLAEKFGEDP